MAAQISAGILVFLRTGGKAWVYLAHPGGPFFARKHTGCWTIPKGEAAEGEDLLAAALREFEEEIAFTLDAAPGPFIPLGSIRQKGGKTVHVWAVEYDLDVTQLPVSIPFRCEWTPRSGQLRDFPEPDQARYFDFDSAGEFILRPQIPFLDALARHLEEEEKGNSAPS